MRRHGVLLTSLAIIAGAAMGFVAPATAHAMTPRLITGPYVQGWFGYWEEDAPVQALAAQGPGVAPSASIFWAKFTGAQRPLCAYQRSGACLDDPVNPWIAPHIDSQRRMLQDVGLDVFGTIVDASASMALSDYLATDANRRAYASEIVEWATKAGFDGVDLDWERFAFADKEPTWATTKPRWIAFVTLLGAKLHARGLKLSATVPAGMFPFRADGRPNPGTGYWVYAWDRIIDHVDQLRLMAYDYSYATAGPIGPYPWAQRVAESAVAQVTTTALANRRKVWLGIPQYSRNWVRQQSDGSYVTRGDCPAGWEPDAGAAGIPGMLTQPLTRAYEIAEREQLTPTWNSSYGEYTFRYWIATSGTASGSAVTCEAEREVWFADTRSARLKAGIVDSQRIGGLAVWEFGYVLDGFYAQMRREIAPPLTLRATFDSPIRKSSSTKVTGRVLRGDARVAGASVQVSWVSASGRTVALGSTRTNARGDYAIKVSPTRSGSLRVTAASEGQRTSVAKPIVVRR